MINLTSFQIINYNTISELSIFCLKVNLYLMHHYDNTPQEKYRCYPEFSLKFRMLRVCGKLFRVVLFQYFVF
jgi:hypothetical protein